MGILVVDDSAISRTAISHLLRQGGFMDIEAVESAHYAFDRLRQAANRADAAAMVDLILMDYDMPEVDGIEATRRLKADSRLVDIPIIMVTSLTDDAYLKAAFEAGAMDYVSKPPRPVELIARVQSALRLKSEMDQRRAREREVMSLVQQLKDANGRLEQLATVDGLTGIPNRRKFDETLAAESHRSDRSGSTLSLLMIDVDCFKRYNDMYGHLAGDSCLQQVARALQARIVRAGDSVARYGGEEFAVLLPGTNLSGAELVGESLRAAIEGLGIPHAASDAAPVVTISVGAAAKLPPHQPPSTLITAADQALYQAKAQGRNRVVGMTP